MVDLRSERFRRRDADLRPGMHVNAAVALARDRAGDVVANAERAITFAPAFAQRAERVGGFSALTDGENERVARHRCVAMTKLAGVFHFSRNLASCSIKIFADHRRHAARCRSRSARRGRHRATAPASCSIRPVSRCILPSLAGRASRRAPSRVAQRFP